MNREMQLFIKNLRRNVPSFLIIRSELCAGARIHVKPPDMFQKSWRFDAVLELEQLNDKRFYHFSFWEFLHPLVLVAIHNLTSLISLFSVVVATFLWRKALWQAWERTSFLKQHTKWFQFTLSLAQRLFSFASDSSRERSQVQLLVIWRHNGA